MPQPNIAPFQTTVDPAALPKPAPNPVGRPATSEESAGKPQAVNLRDLRDSEGDRPSLYPWSWEGNKDLTPYDGIIYSARGEQDSSFWTSVEANVGTSMKRWHQLATRLGAEEPIDENRFAEIAGARRMRYRPGMSEAEAYAMRMEWDNNVILDSLSAQGIDNTVGVFAGALFGGLIDPINIAVNVATMGASGAVAAGLSRAGGAALPGFERTMLTQLIAKNKNIAQVLQPTTFAGHIGRAFTESALTTVPEAQMRETYGELYTPQDFAVDLAVSGAFVGLGHLYRRFTGTSEVGILDAQRAASQMAQVFDEAALRMSDSAKISIAVTGEHFLNTGQVVHVSPDDLSRAAAAVDQVLNTPVDKLNAKADLPHTSLERRAIERVQGFKAAPLTNPGVVRGFAAEQLGGIAKADEVITLLKDMAANPLERHKVLEFGRKAFPDQKFKTKYDVLRHVGLYGVDRQFKMATGNPELFKALYQVGRFDSTKDAQLIRDLLVDMGELRPGANIIPALMAQGRLFARYIDKHVRGKEVDIDALGFDPYMFLDRATTGLTDPLAGVFIKSYDSPFVSPDQSLMTSRNAYDALIPVDDPNPIFKTADAETRLQVEAVTLEPFPNSHDTALEMDGTHAAQRSVLNEYVDETVRMLDESVKKTEGDVVDTKTRDILTRARELNDTMSERIKTCWTK